MKLTSPAFDAGGKFPAKYTKDGGNTSPPLQWSGVPSEAKQLALVFENTTEPWVQWVVYDISPKLNGLPAGIEHKRKPPQTPGIEQGKNSIGNVGYDGPLGNVDRTFHYRFRLCALDTALDVPPGLDEKQLEAAMRGHVLATAELDTQYVRPRG